MGRTDSNLLNVESLEIVDAQQLPVHHGDLEDLSFLLQGKGKRNVRMRKHRDEEDHGICFVTSMFSQPELLPFDFVECCTGQHDPYCNLPYDESLEMATNATELPSAAPVVVEGLGYTPLAFEEVLRDPQDLRELAATQVIIEPERPKPKPWEVWLRSRSVCRTIVLLCACPMPANSPLCTGVRIPSLYRFDPGLTILTLTPSMESKAAVITIHICNLQVVCAAEDYLQFFDDQEDKDVLSPSERETAVLIQYLTEPGEHRRICFLTGSARAREKFVSAITALWQGRRVQERVAVG